jgi:hypothetical protein
VNETLYLSPQQVRRLIGRPFTNPAHVMYDAQEAANRGVEGKWGYLAVSLCNQIEQKEDND